MTIEGERPIIGARAVRHEELPPERAAVWGRFTYRVIVPSNGG